MTSKVGPCPTCLGRYLWLNINSPAGPDANPNNIVLHIIVFGVTAFNHASDSQIGHLQYPTAQILRTQVLPTRPALRPCAARKLSAATATSNENPATGQQPTTARQPS